MGKGPCCKRTGLMKVPWIREEDTILIKYIEKNGQGNWRALPKLAGLLRSGKSCRLRWTNYLNPDIKRGSFTQQEERSIIMLHAILGNKWSTIASQLPGRTDNEIKNFWSTHLKKRLLKMGLDPSTHAPIAEANPSAPQWSEALALMRHKAQWESARLEAEARLSRESLLMPANSSAGHHANNTVEMITIPSCNNPPTDYFLKMWNSEAGKVFRKKSRSRIFSQSYDSSCNVFVQNQPNGSQKCNSASAEWTGDCNVKTPESLSSFGEMVMGQTEHQAPEDSSSSEKLGPAHVHYTGFSELLLDFPDCNNNNIDSAITELSTSFQQQSSWPWPELYLEDHDKDCWSNLSFIAFAHT